MVVLAAVVFWLRPVVRALGGTAAILVVLSLGGYLLASVPVTPRCSCRGTGSKTSRWLAPVLPDRLSILIDGLVAALLAIALDLARSYLGRTAPRALAAVVAVVACLPLVPLPLPAATTPPLPVGWLTALAELRLPHYSAPGCS